MGGHKNFGGDSCSSVIVRDASNTFVIKQKSM